jgi:hypothetical protein
MEERILKFILALRSAGVRISLAESADAFQAIDKMGVKDREKFRVSLQAALVKDSSSLPMFTELFPLFFGSADSPPMTNLSEDLDPDEARMLAEALCQFGDQIREMLERLVKGEQLRQDELQRLGKLVGLTHADDLRYLNWMTQRMEKALRFREVREALKELVNLLSQMGMNGERLQQLRELIKNNLQGLTDQLRQYAGQSIAENLSRNREETGLDQLMNQPFNSLSDQDMERLRKEVQRLAAALRTRIALRQKRSKTGQLDAKATLRSNLKHGSVPIDIKHRERSLKPRLVVLCDISTSMRFCSELMLSLLYALQDQISKTYSFAFIDHLEYISPDFEGQDSRKAVHQVLERMPSGYYNTDLGYSLENFFRRYLDTIDSRTTFLIVGDGRNNYNDPRMDLFTTLARRSRRTIWLNPEGANLWGIGDSDMLEYKRECDIVLRAATLAQLTAAVDKLLTLG